MWSVYISYDVHGQPLKGNTLLPEKLILEKCACGLVRPVNEFPRHSGHNVLIILATTAETGMQFAHARVELLFVIKVHTAKKGLLHEKSEASQIATFKKQTCKTR